jgi:site-specific DNA-adenine methylase
MSNPTSAEPVRLLPSYAGSKSHWIHRLEHLRGRNIVELFAGTGSISVNYAANALLVELDPQLARILSRYDELDVPEVFTRDDYYAVRGRADWWRYAYCLSAMAFSGLFRYSDKGFNATHKGGGAGKPGTSPRHEAMRLQPEYERALAAWRRLTPTVLNVSYADVTDEQITAVGERPLVILDPPYEGTRTPYNDKHGGFDYAAYWARARELAQRFDVIIFDTAGNLERAGYPVHGTRTMKMNGARAAEAEAVSFVTPGSRPTENLAKFGFTL